MSIDAFYLNRNKIYCKYRLYKSSKFSSSSNIFRSLDSGSRKNLFQESESMAKIGKPDDFKKVLHTQNSKTVL